jgi:hypothetical protein
LARDKHLAITNLVENFAVKNIYRHSTKMNLSANRYVNREPPLPQTNAPNLCRYELIDFHNEHLVHIEFHAEPSSPPGTCDSNEAKRDSQKLY